MNQRTQSAITIDAQHKDGDWVAVELAFRQAEMEATRVDQTLSRKIQTQWDYKSLSLSSR